MADLFEELGSIFDTPPSGESSSSSGGEGGRDVDGGGGRRVGVEFDEKHCGESGMRDATERRRRRNRNRTWSSASGRRRYEKRVDWSPGILPRALVLSLGYVVGDAICESGNGLGIAGFVMFVAIVDEFFLEFTWALSKTGFAREHVRKKLEHVLVLVRYFAITALVSAFTEVLKYAFYKEGDISSVVLLMIVIFVIADVLGGATV